RTICSQTLAEVAGRDSIRSVRGRSHRGDHGQVHIDRAEQDEQERSSEPDAADDERMLSRRVCALGACGPERRLLAKELVELSSNRIRRRRRRPAYDDLRRGIRIARNESDERLRVLREVLVDRALDLERARVLVWIVGRLPDQVFDGGGILLTGAVPRPEKA